MDATTTPSISSIVHNATLDFPHILFESADHFSWSPDKQTVFYNETDPQAVELFLHELSHATLKHQTYHRDVELIAMETAAWKEALERAATYGIEISDDTIQAHLDTYREWMHARSTCPACTATGYQTTSNTYACVACSHQWRVNEARLCGLKRYPLSEASA